MTSTIPASTHIDTYAVNGRTVTLLDTGDGYAVHLTLGAGSAITEHLTYLEAAAAYIGVAQRLYDRYSEVS